MSVQDNAALRAELVDVGIVPASATVSVAPAPVGTITLSAAASAGGIAIGLASDHPEIARVPPSVVVAERTTSAFFPIDLEPVQEALDVVISATHHGVVRSATLAVLPALHAQLPPEPALEPTPEPVGAPAAGALAAVQARLPERVARVVVSRPQTTLITTGSVINDADVTSPAWEPRQNFRAALVALLPALPYVATIATVAIYLIPVQITMAEWTLWVKGNPLLVGTAFALLGWVVSAVLYSALFRGTSADQANASAYSELHQRLREVNARLNLARSRTNLSPSEEIALQRAYAVEDLVRTELTKSTAGWMLGTAYVNVWGLIHRVEEALLTVEPAEDVVGAALYDELRLQDSQMDTNPQLLAKLRLAVSRLAPDAAVYLSQQPPATPAATPSNDSPSVVAETARAALREVRQTINEFRDSNWAAMVRTRNHLLGTLAATGAATYLLLALALATRSGDSPSNLLTDSIAAASTFYLVGAVVGLFNRLYGESGSDNSVEDYGLTVARLSLTPVLSGLAAVGGAVVIAMIPAATSGDLLTPASAAVTTVQATPQPAPTTLTTPPPAPTTLRKPTPTLAEIYSLSGNPFGIVVAAIFGLSPALLIGALQNAGEKYRSGLQSTAAAQGRP